jgi:hypothetical protein
LIFILFLINPSLANNAKDDAEYYMPTMCESCIIFANELDADIRRLPSKMASQLRKLFKIKLLLAI